MLTIISYVLFRPSVIKNMVHGGDHFIIRKSGININAKDLSSIGRSPGKNIS